MTDLVTVETITEKPRYRTSFKEDVGSFLPSIVVSCYVGGFSLALLASMAYERQETEHIWAMGGFFGSCLSLISVIYLASLHYELKRGMVDYNSVTETREVVPEPMPANQPDTRQTFTANSRSESKEIPLQYRAYSFNRSDGTVCTITPKGVQALVVNAKASDKRQIKKQGTDLTSADYALFCNDAQGRGIVEPFNSSSNYRYLTVAGLEYLSS